MTMTDVFDKGETGIGEQFCETEFNKTNREQS